MKDMSDARRFVILGLEASLVAELSVFLVVSAVAHHLIIAVILIFVGIAATATSWLLRRQTFLVLMGGGVFISCIGSAMFLLAGLYLEAISAIAVIFFGGLLLFAIIMAPRLVWGRNLSAAEQQREIQKFRRRFLERSL